MNGVTNLSEGSLVRIAPRELVTDDPDRIRHMLHVRTKYRRGENYKGLRFDPARDNLLSQRDDKEHARLRSIMASGVWRPI